MLLDTSCVRVCVCVIACIICTSVHNIIRTPRGSGNEVRPRGEHTAVLSWLSNAKCVRALPVFVCSWARLKTSAINN